MSTKKHVSIELIKQAKFIDFKKIEKELSLNKKSPRFNTEDALFRTTVAGHLNNNNL